MGQRPTPATPPLLSSARQQERQCHWTVTGGLRFCRLVPPHTPAAPPPTDMHRHTDTAHTITDTKTHTHTHTLAQSSVCPDGRHSPNPLNAEDQPWPSTGHIPRTETQDSSRPGDDSDPGQDMRKDRWDRSCAGWGARQRRGPGDRWHFLTGASCRGPGGREGPGGESNAHGWRGGQGREVPVWTGQVRGTGGGAVPMTPSANPRGPV